MELNLPTGAIFHEKLADYKLNEEEQAGLVAVIDLTTVKPVLRNHCHERPPVLKDRTFLAERPTF